MRTKLIPILLVAVVILTLATLVSAAANAFSLPWWTVDGGGGKSQGGDYTLKGSLGQLDAGPRMFGGGFSLAGGFWGGGPSGVSGGSSSSAIYLPLVSR